MIALFCGLAWATSAYDPTTYDQLTAVLVGDGLRPAHAKTLWNELQFRSSTAPLARADISPPLRRETSNTSA